MGDILDVGFLCCRTLIHTRFVVFLLSGFVDIWYLMLSVVHTHTHLYIYMYYLFALWLCVKDFGLRL